MMQFFILVKFVFIKLNFKILVRIQKKKKKRNLYFIFWNVNWNSYYENSGKVFLKNKKILYNFVSLMLGLYLKDIKLVYKIIFRGLKTFM